MKRISIILLIIIAFTSCQQNNKFKVSGTIQNAKGEVLFLEHTGLLKTDILDSVKLGSNGEYSFKAERPVYPDFYRLRIGGKIITFAVDSCERITIDAPFDNFATEYKLTGSQSSIDIQQLRKSVMNIQRKANELTSGLSSEERNAKILEIEKDIETHKEMARKLILKDARSTAAYFALYQKVNDTYLFSPYIKTDKPYCAAVATAYSTFMPDYERSKNIYNLVLDAIRTERQAKNKQAWNEVLATSGTGFIEIELKDKNNTTRRLSDLKGKVTLIDFSAYESENAVDYTFALRDLYNKFHKRGFEIFQISLDQSQLKWEQSVKNIPWICVRDENGLNTQYVATYNISSIPTTFLMDKKGNIIARSLSFKDLAEQIDNCL